jgi:2-polyprenyl-6-methoxyphenol hydroxylase-like FAD-dependent oxidoreductase
VSVRERGIVVAPIRILIVGAGIAGLSLAHALHQRGIAADVVERSSEHRTTGTGLYLPANAVRALGRLGLQAAVADRAQPVIRQRLLDHRGGLLTEFDVGSVWGDVGGCYAISRQALHDLLLSRLDTTGIRLGSRVARVDADGTVGFADGTEDTYDLVVGADGINSAVRTSAFSDREPRFLKQVCWRYTASDTEGAVPDGIWTARLGSRGRSFLTLSLGNGQVYCYAEANSTDATAPTADWRTRFADFTDPVPGLLEQGQGAHFAPLHEITGTDWIREHVILVGDAAHACSPSMAQGGAMALEDSLVLASSLAGATDRASIPRLLAAYRDRRIGRIHWVLTQNHRRDRARNLPGPLRHLLLRLRGPQLVRANHSRLLALP